MDLERTLQEIIEQRERERDRVWSLLIPLGASFAAVIGYVLFHLPPLDFMLVMTVVVFAALLFIPVNAALHAVIRLVQTPVIIATVREEEALLKKFQRIDEDMKIVETGYSVAYLMYSMAMMATLVFAMWSTGWEAYLLYAGAVVFFLAMISVQIPTPSFRRRRKKTWSRRILERVLKAGFGALKMLRALGILGFALATLIIVVERGSREEGIAVAGIVGATLLLLVCLRIWYLLDIDTSRALLQDLRYRLREGTVKEEEAKKAFEAIEILRQSHLFYLGTAKGFIEDMRLVPKKEP